MSLLACTPEEVSGRQPRHMSSGPDDLDWCWFLKKAPAGPGVTHLPQVPMLIDGHLPGPDNKAEVGLTGGLVLLHNDLVPFEMDFEHRVRSLSVMPPVAHEQLGTASHLPNESKAKKDHIMWR